ncbi:ragulator complex protein LAMTOR2-like [Amphibalanus amphitrite]|nr:ragulator complex protein LAMTOR2-like [Amphibalanus amphitrite]
MNLEGAPLAYSGGGSEQQCDVVAAIASNIWAAGTKHGLTVFDDQLALQLFDCEEGRMCVCPVTSLLLCVFGARTVPLGMLRAKAEALGGYLSGPLTEVAGAD